MISLLQISCECVNERIFKIGQYEVKKKKKISRRPRSVARELIPFEALWAGEG